MSQVLDKVDALILAIRDQTEELKGINAVMQEIAAQRKKILGDLIK